VACGSLAFAYRLSQEVERTDEQRKIADRNAALEKEARKDSDENATKAKKAEDLADHQAKLALQTVLDMATTADEKLRPVAELGPLRKELLQLAVKQLPQISKDAVESGKVDRTMGISLQRIGSYYGQMGQTELQTQVIERSLKIFTRLMEEQPQEDWNKFNAAISHEALGEIGRENWADPDKIIFHYNRALEMRKELVAELHSTRPSLFERQMVLAVSYQNWANLALELGDPSKALECAQDALKHSEAAVAADATREYERRQLLSYTYVLMGRASMRLAKPTDAQKYLQKSLALRQEWVNAVPLDDYGKQELGRTLDALGDLETEMGLYSAALDYYQQAHTVFQDLLKRGPNVTEFHWFLANVEYHLGTVHRLMKNEKAAEKNFLSCAKAREGLLKDDKANAQRKVELMLVYARLGRHQEAAKMAQEIIEFAPRHPGKLFSAACGLALCSSGVVPPGHSASLDEEALGHRYTEKAMETLRLAVANGFKDVQGLQINPDLQSLQSRGDFKQFVTQIAKR
jgi:tetratricopeptide (TPR) repeat protein